MHCGDYFNILQAINGLPTGCKISILILLFPQIYWFYLMMVGATKVFCTTSTKPKSVSDIRYTELKSEGVQSELNGSHHFS